MVRGVSVPREVSASPCHVRITRVFLVALFCTFTLLQAPHARTEPVVTVFAAASLTDAVTRIGETYTAKTGIRVRLSFASSSTLARQIEAGAGAEIFLSANALWMDYLKSRSLLAGDRRRAVISNALVLIASTQFHPSKPLTPTIEALSLDGFKGWLAIGDPAHVPAGLYARQALEHLGQWEALQSRMALSDSVRSALALVGRGEAALGVVYRTDASISKQVRVVAEFPAASHDPIVYPFAITAGHDRPDVRNLFDYLTGPEAIEIFERYGFVKN